MNPNLSDWDDDLPPEPEEAYQDLLRALRRKLGFGLFFVQCTPVEADNFIVKLPQEIPQKKIAVLRLVEAIDNLYQPVAEFVKDKQIDILLIKGLDYSLYKYEKRSFGEITEGQFSNLTSVPHILNHLNQQRERFRDDFTISFVFLLRSFSINYFIHRAPDFFDWRSGVFELPTTPEVVEQESNRLLLEADYKEYLKLSPEQKIDKVLEIQDLLAEKHQPEIRKASLLLELGDLLTTAKEYEAAITFYDQALKFQLDNHQAWDRRGVGLGSLERYEEEIASYDKAIEIKPDYHEAWFHRGIALKDLGKWKEALASWEKAIEIKPNDDSTLNWQGNVLNKLGQSEQAIICYDQAIALNSNHPHAWYNKGNVLCKLGRNEEAIASYDQALKIKSDDYEAWNRKGNALFNLGRYEEAIASCDQALEFKPDYHQGWHNRGNLLYKQERYEEALASYKKAQKFDPKCQSGWNELGSLLLKLQRYEEAITSYDQALKIKPDCHYAWYYKGAALIKLGRWKEGNKSINKAIEINPYFVKDIFNTQGKQILTNLLQKLGLQKLVQITTTFLRIIIFRH
ncbi:MAG: tetratricopeptide repeat protein [Nostoc sp.]|uniref:tetratricopeptide repeat protein n=1 Tax=Nostoc sp. TaxID=1180 RepID=UPI002FF970D9